MKRKISKFENLPTDTVLVVLSFLDFREIVQLQFVSKSNIFSVTSNHNYIWSHKEEVIKKKVKFINDKQMKFISTLKNTKEKFIFTNKTIHQNQLLTNKPFSFVNGCYFTNEKAPERFISNLSPGKDDFNIWNLKRIKKLDIFTSLKTVFVGDPKVGKTSLIRGMFENEFSLSPKQFKKSKYYRLKVEKNFHAGLGIWEMEDHVVIDQYIPGMVQPPCGANVLIVCFDVTDRKSFENVWKIWLNPVNSILYKRTCQKKDLKSVLLVGCKADKLSKREVYASEAISVGRDLKFCDFYVETSSKNGMNVKEVLGKMIFLAGDYAIIKKEMDKKCFVM